MPPTIQLRKALFKVRSTSQSVDYSQPWIHRSPRDGSGTGFYIGKNRIMTNAHVVSRGKFITVQKDGDEALWEAQVAFIAHDSDLAILTLPQGPDLKHLKPLEMGSVPKLESPVVTVGYPTGGDQISITKGVVSRIDFRRYVHSAYHSHLLIQVDSAINPGNSGGPVMQNGKVIGVAFQSQRRAQSMGYIIPVPIISRFLKDIEDGTYDGVADSGLILSHDFLNNKALQEFYQIDPSQGGIPLSHVSPWSSNGTNLKKNDLLLKIDDYPIGIDGKINLFGERIDFRAYYDLKLIRDAVSFEILRGHKKQTVSFKIQAPGSNPFPGLDFSDQPRFYTIGGLVFTPLSLNFLQSLKRRDYKQFSIIHKFLYEYDYFDRPDAKVQEYIVLSKRLPDKINTFHDQFVNQIVKKVGENHIHSFQDFVKNLERTKQNSIFIEFYGNHNPMVLDKNMTQQNHQKIISLYNIKPEKWIKK